MSGTTSKLVWVLGCALLLRVTTAVAVQVYLDRKGERFLVPGDAEGYWTLGVKLAHGEPYAIYSPPRRVLRMPGFPLLVAAGVRLFGENLLAVRLMLAVVGTAACGAVFLLGKELLGEAEAVTAAAWAAAAPHLVGFSVLLLSETTFALFLVLCLWTAAKLVHQLDPNSRSAASDGPRRDVLPTSSTDERNRTWPWAAGCGILAALACYVRPSWLLAVPLFVVFLLAKVRTRRALWSAGLLLASLSVMLLPWVVRNYFVTGGKIVVTTLWLGPSLYDSLNPQATGKSNMAFFDEEAVLRTMSEYEMNRYYTRRALKFAWSHPGRVAELAVVKLARFWSPWPNAGDFFNWYVAVPVACFSLVLFFFAVLGWWDQRRWLWNWLLTAGPVLYFSLLHMIFVGSLRYRIPAEYSLSVLAAGAAVLRWQRWSSRLKELPASKS